MRTERQRAGMLRAEAAFQTGRGLRAFVTGDRLVFLKNDRDLGVKNGTLATVEQAAPGRLVARLDGGVRVSVEQARYTQIDHGYAVTLHKAQGATVDRAWVLASGGMDRHLAYVGMTRHRDAVTLYAGRDDFRDEAALTRRLGRARPKVSSLDFAERRGFATEKAWAENARAWMEHGREWLEALWGRAEQAIVVMRERFAGLTQPEPAESQERGTSLREFFRPAAAAPDRSERLRAAFGREQAADPGQEAEARRQALRESFAPTKPAEPKTAEQLRQALRERDPPAVERGRDQDRDQER